MDFTELYKHTSSLVNFSPGAQFILTAVQTRLIVRRADTFQITRTWVLNFDDCDATSSISISHIGWSCDSEYILAACAKKGITSIYKIRDESWNARIEAGSEGLVKSEWAPDGRSVVCFSEWGVRIFFY
jgi:hypothetical protein